MAKFRPGARKVISKPTGTIIERGEGESTYTTKYVEIVSYQPTKGKRFHLTKIKVPCTNAHYLQLTIGDTTFPPDVCADETTFIDWFPWDDGLLGDGIKEVKIEAKAILNTELLYGTIYGEEE